MQEITFNISKADVYKEVARITSYTGAKKAGDADAYDRIYTTDEDAEALERFWQESIAEMCQALIKLMGSEEDNGTTMTLQLKVSSSFDNALLPSMRVSLRSFFVQAIAARWFVYADKGEAKDYAEDAAAMLDDVKRKALWHKVPKRPVFR